MSRHSRSSVTELNPVALAGLDYRLRLGWPVRMDDDEQRLLLLAGEALTDGLAPGSQVVVVDMPADLGAKVSSVLWARDVPAVVFATQRLVYVHPYRFTRWCFLALADGSKRYDEPESLPVPLLDVQVLRDVAVPLPLRRVDTNGTPCQERGNGRVPHLAWVQPPPIGVATNRLLPRLTAVLAAVRHVLTKDGV